MKRYLEENDFGRNLIDQLLQWCFWFDLFTNTIGKILFLILLSLYSLETMGLIDNYFFSTNIEEKIELRIYFAWNLVTLFETYPIHFPEGCLWLRLQINIYFYIISVTWWAKAYRIPSNAFWNLHRHFNLSRIYWITSKSK